MKVFIKTAFGEMRLEMEQDKALALINQAIRYANVEDLVREIAPEIVETKAEAPEEPATPPEKKAAPQSRAETLFGPKSKWSMPAAAAAPAPEPSAESTAGDWQMEGPRGFFHIKCDACGEVKSYYTKNRRKYYSCKCGHSIELSNLLPAYMNCKCGVVNVRYRTNLRDEYISPDCFICGAPVDMELNTKKMVYVTLKD